MNPSSNLIGSCNDETNFPYKILLNDTQVSKIREAFANVSSANIKFSKTQLFKIIPSGGILSDLLMALPQPMFVTGIEVFKRGIKKGITLAKNAAPGLAKRAT